MPFVIVRTRASGAGVCVDGPHALLKHLKSVCQTKEDKALGYKCFKFSWLHSSEAYRGGVEGKLECTHMSVRKILNTIEACGWLLHSTHNHGDSGSEYIFAQNTADPQLPFPLQQKKRAKTSGELGYANSVAEGATVVVDAAKKAPAGSESATNNLSASSDSLAKPALVSVGKLVHNSLIKRTSLTALEIIPRSSSPASSDSPIAKQHSSVVAADHTFLKHSSSNAPEPQVPSKCSLIRASSFPPAAGEIEKAAQGIFAPQLGS